MKTDLAIVGAGLSAMAAACFAARRGLKVSVIGWTRGEMSFASGALDLLGVHPEGKLWDNPWEALSALVKERPDHPYGRLGVDAVRRAWDEFSTVLDEAGLSYRSHPDENIRIATAAGTVKMTHRVPETMWPGVKGLRERTPALIVDFEGMKDFSSSLMVENLKGRWPGLKTARVAFPFRFQGRDRHNVLMAEALDSPAVRADLAELVRPLASGFGLVGFPAVLGMENALHAVSDLSRMIGAEVFEIPTIPPSVPGQRIMDGLDRLAAALGVETFFKKRVTAINRSDDRLTGLLASDANSRITVEARGILLATGRFIGGGLSADLHSIREPLLGLPVHQPKGREEWYSDRFLAPHPVNRSGIEVDEQFRPIGPDGRPAAPNLFAAGSILAHHDWVREKCGSGLSVATACGAVEAFSRLFAG